MESLETRLAPAVFVVTNVGDLDPMPPGFPLPGSLRDAISQANALPGADQIVFQLPPASIIPLSSPLPDITDPVTIDALATPPSPPPGSPSRVTIDGSLFGSGSGFIVMSPNVTIRGMVIQNMPTAGIELRDGGATIIEACLIGVDLSGNVAAANGIAGIQIFTSNNRIGSAAPGMGNVISNNGTGFTEGEGDTGTGVFLDGRTIQIANNVIIGNIIGTNLAGNAGFDRQFNGIQILGGVSDTRIGGSAPGEGNLISGNVSNGIDIFASGSAEEPPSNRTVIQGNLVGTNAAGMSAVPNNNGISLSGLLSQTRIGGSGNGEGNIISGNSQRGISLTSGAFDSVDQTRIEGNFIGTNRPGTAALPNGDVGIIVDAATTTNTIIGGPTGASKNVISGNANTGVYLTDAGSTSIQNNIIGLDASGANAIPGQASEGVRLESTTIGATVRDNVISGNAGNGISIDSAETTVRNSLIAGNRIGTDATGTLARGNMLSGILLGGLVTGTTIGGTTASDRNLISGNVQHGIRVIGSGVQTTIISGNYIGTDLAGAQAIGNVLDGITLTMGNAGTIIGGSAAGAGNVISGNGNNGVSILDNGTTNNSVLGNLIGLNASGAGANANLFSGVVIDNGAALNIIGGSGASRNTISGNRQNGILINGSLSQGNKVLGNVIGLSVAGTQPVGNLQSGILVQNGAPTTTIGAGTGQGNVISGNGLDGIRLLSAGNGTIIQHNRIGVLSAGNQAAMNLEHGIEIVNTSNTLVGGVAAGNVIAFNGDSGVTVVEVASGGPATGNAILQNSIFNNNGLGIDLGNDGVTPNTPGGSTSGPNLFENYPVLIRAIDNAGVLQIDGSFNSRPNENYLVELLFSSAPDPSGFGEGEAFVRSINLTTDSSGNAPISLTITPYSPSSSSVFVTTRATDTAGNTSEFSNAVQVFTPLGGVTLTGRTVIGTLAVPLTNALVASFTDASSRTAAEFSATIDWGDGTPVTTGTITQVTGGFEIRGDHNYLSNGNFNITVTVALVSQPGLTKSVVSMAQIADVTVLGININPVKDLVFTSLVATINDPAGRPASAYTATINWGDGTPASVGNIFSSSLVLNVEGTHVYRSTGSFTVTITVTFSAFPSVTRQATATAMVQGIVMSPASVSGVVGSPLSNVLVATFTDPASRAISEFSASIDWNDGTSASPGTIAQVGAGYEIRGSHNYLQPGSFAPVVTLTLTAQPTIMQSIASQATISDVTLTAIAVQAVKDLTFSNVPTASISDPASRPASAFTATINWGDGTPISTGTVVATPSGLEVQGDHLYSAAGTFNAITTITLAAFPTVSRQTSSVVTVRAIVMSPASISGVVGAPLNQVVVATFTDPGNRPPGAFTATINWGDSTANSPGTIVQTANGYEIRADHVYAQIGSFNVNTTLALAANPAITQMVISPASIADFTISPTGVTGVKDVALNMVVVGTINDPAQRPASEFFAQIDWGDQSQATTGFIVQMTSGLQIRGNHTYRQAGNYVITIIVGLTNVANVTRQAASSAVIDKVSLSPTAIAGVVGIPLNNVLVATFTDPAQRPASDFEATIDWGDQARTLGQVVAVGSGYEIRGNHTYLQEGSFPVTVALGLASGPVIPDTVVSTAMISTYSIQALNVVAVNTIPLNGVVVANIMDVAQRPPIAFFASIDWGDQTGGSAGFIVSTAAGLQVQGTHTYANEGTFTITVRVGLTSAPSVVQADTSIASVAGYVTGLYETVLERDPDAPGLAFWQQQLAIGKSRDQVATAFWESLEHRTLEVNQFYTDLLSRPADTGGLNFWVNQLLKGVSEAQVVISFLTSPEYTASHQSNQGFVEGLYRELYNRQADASGLSFWTQILNNGARSRSDIVYYFLTSNEAYVRAVFDYYEVILERQPDPLGGKNLFDLLVSGKVTPVQVVSMFLGSDEYLQLLQRRVLG